MLKLYKLKTNKIVLILKIHLHLNDVIINNFMNNVCSRVTKKQQQHHQTKNKPHKQQHPHLYCCQNMPLMARPLNKSNFLSFFCIMTERCTLLSVCAITDVYGEM